MTVPIGEAVAEQGVDSDELDSDVSDDPESSDYELQGSDESSNEECDLIRNRYQYPELSKAVDRCRVSNRDACLIANAVLRDMKLLSSANTIDPAKLRRQRILWREKEVQQHADENKGIICLGFDGKQDLTLIQTSSYRRRVKEEHYCVISFPGSTYIDHVVPESSKAADVAKEIMSVIVSTDSSSSLRAVVCDGTNNNTGKNNGIIRKLEENLGRPLQWLVCLLHCNELPFRTFFQ
jgi:hypothetical protein